MPGQSKDAYGWEHQKARRAAHAAFIDGTPCPICHRPMRGWQSLDLDHTIPVVKGGMGGPTRLAHSYCNRRVGAVIGNRSAKRKGGTRISRSAIRIRSAKPSNRSATNKEGDYSKDGNPLKDGHHPKRTLPKW